MWLGDPGNAVGFVKQPIPPPAHLLASSGPTEIVVRSQISTRGLPCKNAAEGREGSEDVGRGR